MQLESWDVTHKVLGSCVEVVVRGRSIVHQATQQTGTKHHGNLMYVFRSTTTTTTTTMATTMTTTTTNKQETTTP